MGLASWACLLLVWLSATASAGQAGTGVLPFCDDLGSAPRTPVVCAPCPGRCVAGKLVACRRGLLIGHDKRTCEPDPWFRTKVDVMKASLAKDLEATDAVDIESLRGAKRGDGYDAVIDEAVEEMLKTDKYILDDDGRLALAKSKRWSRWSATFSMFLAFITPLLGWLGNYIRMRIRSRYATSSMLNRGTAGQPPHLQAHSTQRRLPQNEEPRQYNNESTNTNRDIGTVASEVSIWPNCVVCHEPGNIVVAKCGHIISCDACMSLYRQRMAQTGDYRCPLCRRDASGDWIRVHGVGG